ncbi:phytoene/squalene synthase family protein [Roseicella frigidaeris]|uniref:Phytoene/squalene synthase family protein n=1 Tax=Roseicella frigidaeris TaxID=2230885 RepID=A0A327M5S7_9PROT|nr:phytoene/squalene synthase family protein [Roseicella frigidaeris]RAI57674.1 phytoene/squalene synthase family protein [Roseicella frigidaeris]
MPMRWPDSPAAAAAARADLAACRALLRGGSRSFQMASLLLPKRVARPAAALYAFCRLADDAIDGTEPGMGAGGAREAALAGLQARLHAAYAGRPAALPADRAFALVVAQHGIPRALPEALLEGLAWDAAGRRYPSLAALEDYAARVAGAVGAMMALLMGARGGEALARASDLGVAMQLTNIARDIGEDARAGRLYLPLDWLREAGLAPEAFLAAPAFQPGLGTVVARLLRRADWLYARAEAGIALLPADCRPGIAAARLLYAEIGRQVERQGLDSVAARAVVPARRKAALLLRSAALALRAAPAPAAPPLAANRFLLRASAAEALPPEAPLPGAFDIPARLARVLHLFERLERRDRAHRPAGFEGLSDGLSDPARAG